MSVEQPPTPPLAPPGGSGGWTITKSEWDGCGAVNNSVTKFSWIAQAILMLFGLGALAYAIWRAPAVFTPYLIGAIALFLIAVIAQGLWTRRAVRRWARLIPVVWESNGCVCPYCRTRVDETPCTRHGLSATEAPLLRDYWQAMATRDLAGTQRALQALLNAARRRSMFVRLTGPLTALWRKSITASNDSTLSAWGRLRGSLPFIGVELVVLVAGGIGITPLHSLFAEVYACASRVKSGQCGSIEHVVLLWAGRSDSTFCLFAPTFHKVSQRNPNGAFEFYLFNSAPGAGGAGAAAGALGAKGAPPPPDEVYMGDIPHDAVVYTKSVIQRGRPPVAEKMSEVAQRFHPDDVMVMACGPQALILSASSLAFQHGFHFHTEVFHF